MEQLGGWNYVHGAALAALSEEDRARINQNPFLHAAMPALPGAEPQEPSPADAADALLALAAAPRISAPPSPSPRAAARAAQPLAEPRSAKRPAGAPPAATPRAAKAPRVAVQAQVEALEPSPPVNTPRLQAVSMPALVPLDCSEEERGFLRFALRELAPPLVAEATAAARHARLLQWIQAALATLHPALPVAVADVHVTRLGTSTFAERWRPHPTLLASARAQLSTVHPLPPGDSIEAPGVWLSLPALLALLVAHVSQGAVTPPLTAAAPHVFPSALAADTWHVLRGAVVALRGVPLEQRTPAVAVAAAQVAAAAARVQSLGRGQTLVVLGDRGAGKTRFLNALLLVHHHAAGYDAPPPSSALLVREGLEHIAAELSSRHVGVTWREVATRGDVDIITLPAAYAAAQRVRAPLAQAVLDRALNLFKETGSFESAEPFVLPVRNAASAAPAAVKITFSHALHPHVLVTYHALGTLQAAAAAHPQRAADALEAGRVATAAQYRPPEGDADAVAAQHTHERLCGALQMDADARPVTTPSALALAPEVAAVAGARRLFRGLGLNLPLDLAWARDMLQLALGAAGKASEALAAFLHDDDAALGRGELRWRRQAAAVRDVHVFLPCTLLANGLRLVRAPAADCSTPLGTAIVRECLSEASTVLWLRDANPAVQSPAAAHLSAAFLPAMLTPWRLCAATTASQSKDAAQLLPQTRLVALHWGDAIALQLSGVARGPPTWTRFEKHLRAVTCHDTALAAAMQADLQVRLAGQSPPHGNCVLC